MNEKSKNCRICNKEFTDKQHVNLHGQKKVCGIFDDTF